MAKRGKSVQTRKQKRFQKALVKMMIIDKLPFSYVEDELFKELVLEATFPGFRMPSLDMINKDCAQLFLDEKLKLKSFIKRTNQRVCLALDTWTTSNQSVNYLCVTAHFIGNNWKLHKKIINFSQIFSKEGEEIGKAVEKCLHDWEITNVMTISVGGDASVNEVAISYIKRRLVNNVLDGKYLYLKCIVDFFNTMVKECLNRYDESITRVREAVRYVIESSYRVEKFKKRASEWSKRKCCLCLDCPTNWKTSLKMLKMSKEFDEAFYVFENKEDTCEVPSYEDWKNIEHVVYFLEGYERSAKDTSRLYVSSHEFLTEISDLYFHLCNCGKQVDDEAMKWALDRLWDYYVYWGDVAKDSNVSFCVWNMFIYVANILDPRLKTDFFECYFMNIFKHEYTDDGENLWKKKAEMVIAAIYEMFNEYVGKTQQKANFETCGYKKYLYEDTSHIGLFERHEIGFGGNVDCKTEIDIYLNEGPVEGFKGFNVLLWWKYNSERYPILSKMAKDILAIPISAVAPNSIYRVDGNLLDDYRSSLSPSTVEALVCTRDWILKSKRKSM